MTTSKRSPKQNVDFAVNNKFAVTGFGRTSPGDGQSNLLLKALIPIMSDDRCGQLSYPLTSKLMEGSSEKD